jgi:hypothetical protein
MKETYSKIVFGLSCIGVVVTAVFSLVWLSIVIDHDGRGAVASRSVFGPVLGSVLLALVVIPSGVLFLSWRQRRDLWSLLISALSLLGVIGEVVALYFVRLHGPW